MSEQSNAWARWIEPILKRRMLAEGGFTLSPRDASPLESGLAVCADPRALLLQPSDTWDTGKVNDWLISHYGQFLERGLSLGGWLDVENGVTLLEPVCVYPEHLRKACLATASMNGRRSIFNLAKRELIYLEPSTGTTKTSPVTWGCVSLEAYRREYLTEGCALLSALFPPELIRKWHVWALASGTTVGKRLDAIADETWIYQEPNQRHAYVMVDGDVLRSHLPEMVDLYLNIIPLLSAITMRTVLPSPFPKSDMNLLMYDNPGCAIGWHRDTNPVTILLYLSDNEDGGTECCLLKSTPEQETSAGPRRLVKPRAGVALLMQGRVVLHRSQPMTRNNVKVTCTWNYYTSDDFWRPPGFDELIYGR